MRCMFVYLQSPSSKVQTISKSDRHCSTSKSETLHCESLGAWGVGWGTLDNCRKTTKPLLKHGCFGADSRLKLVLESVWTVPLSRHYQNQHPDCAGWQTQTQQHITLCVLKGWGSKCHTPAQPTTQCPDQEKLSNVGRSRNCNSDRGTHHRQRQRHLSQTATEAPISINELVTHIQGATPVLLTACTSMGKLAQTDRKRTGKMLTMAKIIWELRIKNS